MIKKIRKKIKDNKNVVENYIFMTLLQVLNSLFYFIVFPFLIRTLGAESYGYYVFAFSIASYFITFISFGFDWVAVRDVSKNISEKNKIESILSGIFTAKLLLLLVSMVVFFTLLISIPKMRENWILYSICFSGVITNIIFPVWYFQALEKMKIVTCIQVAFKLISLPFIFIFIKNPQDNIIFATIVTSSSIIGGCVASFMIRFIDKIKIRILNLREITTYLKECLPIFLASSAGTLKQQGATTLIGAFFSMSDVALYDLAVKILLVPQTLTTSINSAIFPKIVKQANTSVIKKIISYEFVLSLFIIVGIVVFGKWAILILGGKQMVGAYPLLVILSITMIPWLIVIAYTFFVFVKQKRYSYVTINQVISACIFFIVSIISIIFFKNIMWIAAATSIAGIVEVFYFRYIIRKHKLLHT